MFFFKTAPKKIWKNTHANNLFEQLKSNLSVWIEISSYKDTNYFVLHEETLNEQVILYDQSRRKYIKLGSSDAKYSYSLSENFDLLYVGEWINRSKPGKKFINFNYCYRINLFTIRNVN